MANRRGQNISVGGAFSPQPMLNSGVAPVAYADGSNLRVEADAYSRLANQLSNTADEFAIEEGRQAGVSAGNERDFRPTGGITLRARAFDRAAIDSYQDNLQADLRMDMASVYEQFVTLPASEQQPTRLAGMFAEVRQGYEANRVFDEIRGGFNNQWAVWETSYRKAAVDGWEARQRDQAQAATMSMLSASQTAVSRAIVIGAENPETAALIENERISRQAAINAAVSRGDLSAVQGQQILESAAKQDGLRLEQARIGNLDTFEAIDAYETDFKARADAGRLDVLGDDGILAAAGAIDARRNALRTEGVRLGTRAKSQLDDIVKRAEDGFDIPAEELAAARTAALQTPDGESVVRLAESKLMIAAGMRGRGPEEIERVATVMREQANVEGANPNAADLVRFTEGLAKSKRTALATDLVGQAERDRLVAPTPLDIGSDAFAGQLGERLAAAKAAASTYGRPLQVLRPDERERLVALTQAGGDPALFVAEQIVAAAGPDAPTILKEVGGDAPALTMAGAILVNGGSRQAARDLFQAQAIKAIPGAKLMTLPPLDEAAIINETVGTAFLEHIEDGQRVRASTREIAAVRIEQGRLDPVSSEAKAVFERALQEASGARFVDDRQYGGVGTVRPAGIPIWGFREDLRQVVVPPGVDASRFGDLIQSITDEDLVGLPGIPLDEIAVIPGAPGTADGRPFRARDLHRATPVATKGGYRFIVGDPGESPPRYVTTQDGQPFRLDWQAIEPKLRTRHPDAFLGGR